MKPIIYLLLSLSAFSGCQHSKDKDESALKEATGSGAGGSLFSMVPSEDKFELSVDSIAVDSLCRIFISIKNHLDTEISVGKRYDLACYRDSSGTWESLLPPHTSYLLVSQVIPPHATAGDTIYLKHIVPGKYRVTKTADYMDRGQPASNLLIGEFDFPHRRREP